MVMSRAISCLTLRVAMPFAFDRFQGSGIRERKRAFTAVADEGNKSSPPTKL